MADDLNDYIATTADWRKTIARNNHRTYIVIGLFFLIYIGIGLLLDLYLQASHYPNATLSHLFEALLTLKLFPLATLVMIVVAALSLFVSYLMHDRLMLLGTEYHEVTPETSRNQDELKLYNIVEEMKIAAGLRYMPRVFVIDADYMNAFASGYSEKSAMVAITAGLMQKLTRDEMQAVMAHEISHIRHLDIKLTLTASLLANMTLIVLDIFFYNALYSNKRRGNGSDSKNTLAAIIIILRYLLPVINVILLLYLSRTRELMADAGCVQLMRANQPLASALLKIQDDHQNNSDTYKNAYQQTPHENIRREAYIFDPTQAGILSASSISDLFSTHPDIKTRLAALGFKSKNDFK